MRPLGVAGLRALDVLSITSGAESHAPTEAGLDVASDRQAPTSLAMCDVTPALCSAMPLQRCDESEALQSTM
jgi:hypothetical protein